MIENNKIEISLNMRNAAFDDRPMSEVARILRELADKIENTGDADRTLYDVNGNKVGYCHFTEEN